MLSKAVLLASVATMAMAQSSSTCAAQVTMDACINTIKGQIAMCQTNDYDCLCNQYGNLLTCYANCPSDSGVSSVQQQRTQYCAAASAYPSTSSTFASVATTALSALTSTHTTTTGTGTTASHTGTSSSGTASATSTAQANGAASIEVAGGVIAALFAGLGLLA